MRKQLLSLAMAAILPLSLSIPAFAVSSQPEQTSIIAEQTWRYLQDNAPGDFSIAAHSLGQREQKPEAVEAFYASLEGWADTGFTADNLEHSILNLLKLEDDPENYKRSSSVKYNLFPTLYTHNDLYRTGLLGACGALYCYEAIATEVPASARNSAVTVLDSIVSSQQQNGGFSQDTGHDPEVTVTATALLALHPHRQFSYVNASAERATQWLSGEQNANATFSAQKRPSLVATASALIALRSCGVPLDDPRFVKNNANLLDALALFGNADGGYALFLGEPSDPTATELAVIAQMTAETGLAPYLPPNAYPGYQPPAEPKQDQLATYLAFFVKLMGMFAVLFILVVVTPKLAKLIDQKRSKHKIDEPLDTDTFEIHIPMKAPLPNFDELPPDPPAPSASPKDDSTSAD